MNTTTLTLTEEQAYEAYEEMLDEVYETVRIGDLEFDPSAVLKQCDPIAYHLGFADYVNSLMEDGEKVEGWD
jgi:hypothetical protein